MKFSILLKFILYMDAQEFCSEIEMIHDAKRDLFNESWSGKGLESRTHSLALIKTLRRCTECTEARTVTLEYSYDESNRGTMEKILARQHPTTDPEVARRIQKGVGEHAKQAQQQPRW